MIDKQADLYNEEKISAGCGCGICESQEVKKQCQCESCRKNNQQIQQSNKDKCHWKDLDQLRKRRCELGDYNKNKFIWETHCECGGCR